jgi:hypothetical protein
VIKKIYSIEREFKKNTGYNGVFIMIENMPEVCRHRTNPPGQAGKSSNIHTHP